MGGGGGSNHKPTKAEFADRVADLARRGVIINASPDIIPFEIPLGDRSALPSPLSLSMPTLSGTPLSLSPLIPSPGSVLSSQCPMLRGLLVLPPMFSRCRKRDPCRLLASVFTTFLDAEPAHSSSSRWLVLDDRPSGGSLAEVMLPSAATKAGTDRCELWVATSLKHSSSTVRPIISKPSMLVVALELPSCRSPLWPKLLSSSSLGMSA